jgi:hypothetical protein
MRKLSIAVGWDKSGKPKALGLAAKVSELKPLLKKPGDGIVEVALYRDPHAFKRRRHGTPPIKIVVGHVPPKPAAPAAPPVKLPTAVKVPSKDPKPAK